MLHTIVQINLNHLIRQRVNFFLILMQLSVLRLHFVQLLSQLDTLAGAGGSGHLFFQTFDGSTVACLLLMPWFSRETSIPDGLVEDASDFNATAIV